MVRFSCFNGHIGSQKPKKTVQPSVEVMHTILEDFSQVQAPKESFLPGAETTAEIHDRAQTCYEFFSSLP
ncbi:hypothetical protein V6N13_017681 [Hibiscus sabdariffa]